MGTTQMSPAEKHKLTANIKAQGCAAKLSPLELAQIVKSLPKVKSENLLCGTDNFEDAAVYKFSDELAIVSTIDFFPPLIDDPYLYGRIAAVNALSDVYAMGGKPLLALNVFCFPSCDYPLTLAEEIIRGGASAVDEAGCLLVGGHSIQAPEPIYGLSVIGTVSPQRILTNAGAKEADKIVLCKPLGMGVGLLSHKGGMLSENTYKELISNLCRLNGPCLEIALKYDLHAATDITGFGLIGHLHEMAKASGLKVRLNSKELPLLPEVLQCAEQGLVPAAAYANRKAYSEISRIDESVDLALSDLLFDPQTSGGLLFSVSAREAFQLAEELKQAEWPAKIIGDFLAGESGLIEVF
ncbi:MAG: selenide, water dikinase SelD [Candidatus Obscuribacterales bacterium]|nr:selenide, water dikinase SelD [Candidatus Obscuribacterales bacterium]